MSDRPPISTALQTSAFDPDAREDPYPRLKALQAEHPVFRDEVMMAWFLTRYGDVKAIANDRTLWRHPVNAEEGSFSRRLINPELTEEEQRRSGSILFLDDPDHARIRQPLMKAFYARVAQMKTGIEGVISDVFERLGRPARFELMADVAIPIPILAIARILGVEEARYKEFREWSEGVILALTTLRTPEQTERMQRAGEAVTEYFFALMRARRENPQDDLISDLVQLQAEGAALRDEEIAANLIALLVGGNLTTSDLIGNGVRLLLTHPEELAKLKADPSLATATVEEVLRYESPVDITSRIASRDMEVGGCPVKQRQTFLVSLRGANRDPSVFENPDRFDITRKHVPHVAFGGGAHICIGQPLARIEAAAVFREIFTRFPDLRLPEQTLTWRTLPFFRGLETLWVETGV
ncbi:MAG TPA: cytochrome P450 [Vitreimonas sp.]|jgi:cytochrome P450|nr:cytochrome P450 [Vitreimonas sp.]